MNNDNDNPIRQSNQPSLKEQVVALGKLIQQVAFARSLLATPNREAFLANLVTEGRLTQNQVDDLKPFLEKTPDNLWELERNARRRLQAIMGFLDQAAWTQLKTELLQNPESSDWQTLQQIVQKQVTIHVELRIGGEVMNQWDSDESTALTREKTETIKRQMASSEITDEIASETLAVLQILKENLQQHVTPSLHPEQALPSLEELRARITPKGRDIVQWITQQVNDEKFVGAEDVDFMNSRNALKRAESVQDWVKRGGARQQQSTAQANPNPQEPLTTVPEELLNGMKSELALYVRELASNHMQQRQWEREGSQTLQSLPTQIEPKTQNQLKQESNELQKSQEDLDKQILPSIKRWLNETRKDMEQENDASPEPLIPLPELENWVKSTEETTSKPAKQKDKAKEGSSQATQEGSSSGGAGYSQYDLHAIDLELRSGTRRRIEPVREPFQIERGGIFHITDDNTTVLVRISEPNENSERVTIGFMPVPLNRIMGADADRIRDSLNRGEPVKTFNVSAEPELSLPGGVKRKNADEHDGGSPKKRKW